ncbi:hypothetical protein FsymDg_2190 [Candidatus Protofrankia datiscae]|uniref:Uncharacterized protein n=1 Tax=Candidatus Protofrankia datiscae TaxID=2716812 RepID=F8B4D0_9ACTN|nr:hypothetical protein FsymDg_2190 [Candidatus Protofrankia datiscae]
MLSQLRLLPTGSTAAYHHRLGLCPDSGRIGGIS